MVRTVPVAGILAAAATAAAVAAPSHTGWAALHRPLHLPRVESGTTCPVSRVDRRVDWDGANIFGGSGIGRGPVYAGLGPAATAFATPDEQFGSRWGGAKVFWYVLPSYRGRVLLRGRRLDGPQRLGFNGRRIPETELRIDVGETVGWDGQVPGSRGVPSGIRVLVPGCYGVQADGSTFSRVIVFRVTLTG
jgi:hypothetical protein